MTLGPLGGFTIGVTADRRADEQISLLERRGSEIVHGPSIRTLPLGPDEDVRAHTEQVIAMEPDVVMLMTGIGVRGWFEAAEALGLADRLRDVLLRSEVWCRGPKATGAAIAAGLEVAWTTRGERSGEMLARVLLERTGADVVVQLDGSGDLDGLGELAGTGTRVMPITVYRYETPTDTEPARRLIRAAIDGRLDAVTFTSRPSVFNLVELASADGLDGQLLDAFAEAVVPICIGSVCSDGAAEVGIHDALVPPRPRLGSLVQSTAAYFSSLAAYYEAGGAAVRVQGRALEIGGETVMLGDRERDVLRILLAAKGAVVAKSALLRSVWRGTESDEHVVEVTVARLRRRLGCGAEALETVFRRGYRWSAVATPSSHTRPPSV